MAQVPCIGLYFLPIQFPTFWGRLAMYFYSQVPRTQMGLHILDDLGPHKMVPTKAQGVSWVLGSKSFPWESTNVILRGCNPYFQDNDDLFGG